MNEHTFGKIFLIRSLIVLILNFPPFFLRYFNITGRRESSDCSSDAKEQSCADESHLETEDGEGEGDTTSSSTSQPGGLLTILKENMEEHLSDSDLARNCSDDEENMEENDKENELRTYGESNESPMFGCSKGKREEESTSQQSSPSQNPKCSPRKLQTQSVLTSHSSNIRDTPKDNAEKSDESSLGKRFGYRRSMKTKNREDRTSESLRQKTKAADGMAVQPIEVIDVDSGYLSDNEMSTDGDTPTPTQSGVLRITPPSIGGNAPLMRGSAAGTKVC